jgi:hypothetical protein
MPAFSAAPRREAARSSLPIPLAPQIPRRGLYAAGGGLVSSAWRVALDLDTGVLRVGRSAKTGSSSIGPMPEEWKRCLDADTLHSLIEAADAAWREPDPLTPPNPTADYGEVLVIADDDAVFYHDGYGPIRRARAAKAVELLRIAAGLR